MNFSRALTQMWTMLSRTRVFRLALTILCVFVALRFILQKRAAQMQRQQQRQQRATGVGGQRVATRSSGNRAAGLRRPVGSPFDEDLSPVASKSRSPCEQYLRASRRRYPICVATSCVFAQTTVATDNNPISGDDTTETDPTLSKKEEKVDSNGAVPSTSEEIPQQTNSKARFHLRSDKTSEILTKLVENHDVYLVCHLGRSSGKESGDGKDDGSETQSTSSMAETTQNDESSDSQSPTEADMSKAVLDFCRDLNLFDSGLREHRVLFCTTDIGKTAIMRQLEPHLLIDDDLDNAQQLAKVLPNSRVVLTQILERKNARITDVAGFDAFFSEKSATASSTAAKK